MKFKGKDQNLITQPIKPTQPTIWALRRNVRAVQDNEPQPMVKDVSSSGTLYEHLFGYDPIQVRSQTSAIENSHGSTVSAENPKLNIINPQTNFLVREMVSDDPSNA